MTGAELRAAMEERHAEDHNFDDIERGIRLSGQMEGLDLHQRAMKLLARPGCHSPSYDEYVAAVLEVAL
jgi:hypothetical protein